MGTPSRNKLFHAIVGLGLAAAGCGGKEQAVAGDMDAGEGVHRDGASTEGGDAHVDAAMTADAGALIVPGEDSGSALDAARAPDVAADVAQDVADETWHVVPIQ